MVGTDTSLGVTAGQAERSTSTVARQTENAGHFRLLETPHLKHVWHSALLDAFLTTWLPHSLVRECSKGGGTEAGIPMSAWPSIAWKVARENENGLVAQSLLCLTLAVLGVRTENVTLRAEASRQYGRVLHQFQYQVALLAQTGYIPDQAGHVASLVAAGFCCSQIEYILRSWTNGDRHLEGIGSIVQACGSLCLECPDIRKLSLDHRLLWTSCLVVHHRRPIESETLATQVGGTDDPTQALVAIAAGLASLLERQDASLEQLGLEGTHEFLLQFSQIDTQLDAFLGKQPLIEEPRELDRGSRAGLDFDPDRLKATVMHGYALALHIQTVAAAWQMLRSCDVRSKTFNSDLPQTEDQSRATCELRVRQLCLTVTGLANERYGMVTASPLLFMIDSAFLGYTVLARYDGYDLTEIRGWFTQIGAYMASTGYRPLREPWLE
ncbi:hypothetical protein LTR56_027679 [Elasticomyces elasticus]|nr:hypothetical protein LTR56_027679 [Elasticomyces elasticus]